MKQAGLPAPKFEFTNFFTVTFKRPLTPQVRKMLEICKEPCSREEIQHILGFLDREHLRKAYIQPALKAGWLVMTIANKPRSRKQRYLTTLKGKEVLDKLKEELKDE